MTCYVVQMHMSDSYLDKSELQKLKMELEARAQRELDAKLDEVNAYLMEQARARERLDKVRGANEMELRKEFENMRKDLLVSLYVWFRVPNNRTSWVPSLLNEFLQRTYTFYSHNLITSGELCIIMICLYNFIGYFVIILFRIFVLMFHMLHCKITSSSSSS